VGLVQVEYQSTLLGVGVIYEILVYSAGVDFLLELLEVQQILVALVRNLMDIEGGGSHLESVDRLLFVEVAPLLHGAIL